MATRCRGSCPLTFFCGAFGRLCFDYPLAGCFPALPASVWSKATSFTSTNWLIGIKEQIKDTSRAISVHAGGEQLALADEFGRQVIAEGSEKLLLASDFRLPLGGIQGHKFGKFL